MINQKFIEFWDDYCLTFEGCTLIQASHDPYSNNVNFSNDWFTDISGKRIYIELIERSVNFGGRGFDMKLIDICINGEKLRTLEEINSPAGVYYIEYNEE